ncbi:uncharacterized protein LACBIDRAFT_331089 [Laccaria bicolor S238N-H82]|uniref:Predicted protein n=1 Tax=Laccaria bicolor (strain S238N-H82 / ATCC MYA-4686) TaxID=486041 RepID=B0DNF9_LACBS|nr:uncharacterized protein LACBIDRAFT_331089 [Laccaria bicolor S238N-H82]EDR03932.1 predicted protein [Laccaria bicolor S238N-H82]|eukprot:XP_001885500.1 predicted protein [Laccaria bicolor S238N-H82]
MDRVNNTQNCLDFKVKVEPEAFEYVREKFAPPSNPVFMLGPSIFAAYAGQAYTKIGSSELNSVNIWPVYCEISGGLYAATAYPSRLWPDSVGLRVFRTDIFSALQLQQFSGECLKLFRAFLVGPLSLLDFSNGLPMD